MLEKLEVYEQKYKQLMKKMSDPEVSSDPSKIKEYGKKISELEQAAKTSAEYRNLLSSIDDIKEMQQTEEDSDMKSYLEEELNKNLQQKQKLEKNIKLLLSPKDPNDQKNVIIEVRAGAGGDEAALFAGDLYRMYTKYADSRGWRHEVLSSNSLGIGGFKEIIFSVEGKQVYGTMKYESGVHRVQRIPVTESGGRIHTSTATVAVMAEAEDIEVTLDPQDVRVDVYRSSGPGGQSVNTTDSAVRLTHVPTGIVVSCQDEKSQLQNKEKAFRILRTRIREIEEQKQMDKQTENRRLQIGSGDRSERIRTYNFPQGRITDHRINLTVYKLDNVLNGDLSELIESLKVEDEAKKIEKIGA
ncbi:MAG: peptide chain release factor 1 [Actinomycetia bacterium]|nr:peptide chain release factor 1 [Actinomycetes bacterium]